MDISPFGKNGIGAEKSFNFKNVNNYSKIKTYKLFKHTFFPLHFPIL